MIRLNLDKTKNIAHDVRRQMRDDEFAPFDKIVSLQLAGKEEAEAQRVMIREKYAVLQANIDKATTLDEIKTLLGI